MFDELRASCTRDLRRLHTVGADSQDHIRSILTNQENLNRRVSVIEATGSKQGVDVVRLEQLEGAHHVIQHVVEDLSQ